MCVLQGDQYDVREKEGGRDVRNLGRPVDLAARYFDEGADEVTFLNITGFRDSPLQDLPMLEVLKQVRMCVCVFAYKSTWTQSLDIEVAQKCGAILLPAKAILLFAARFIAYGFTSGVCVRCARRV